MSAKMAHWLVPLGLFAVLIVHGSLVGISDDEAYYWVLAQKPAWGYAYHPPAVAWFIAAAQALLGWVVPINSPGLVRLPAAVCSAAIMAIALAWVRLAAPNAEKGVGTAGAASGAVRSAAMVLLSFAGFFSLSWMMVPDLPMMLGWMMAFYSAWVICFGGPRTLTYLALCFGVSLGLLSKFSAILFAFSVFLSLVLFAPRERRLRGLLFFCVGVMLGVFPTLVWNITHEWGSILYQIKDRHGTPGISLIRYGRFWLSQILLAGPVIVGFGFAVVGSALFGKKLRQPSAPSPDTYKRLWQYVTLWMIPAVAVFCVQPLWSDFKPHWGFVVWWPAALALAVRVLGSSGLGFGLFVRGQVFYGLVLSVLILVSCHVPIMTMAGQWFRGNGFNPTMDVTNDLCGWSGLASFIEQKVGKDGLSLPIVGSRYQTASQAAFSFGTLSKVTMIPRDLKAKDEWPDLGVTDGHGPAWPRLTSTVLFVADNRYQSGPEFQDASCESLGRLESLRFGYLTKWVTVWRCGPK